MTGYGKAEAQLRDKNILLEIKSLNSKNLDPLIYHRGNYLV